MMTPFANISKAIFGGGLFFLMLSCKTYVLAHGLSHDRVHLQEHAIMLTPDNPALYVNRGRIYHDSEQWEKALDDYAKALQIDPKYFEAMYWQGNAFLQTGDLEQAKKTIKDYLTLKPHSPAGHNTLAKIYTALGSYPDAAEQYDMAIAHDNTPLPQVYIDRARTLMEITPLPLERINTGLVNAIKRHGTIITILQYLIELNIKIANYQAAAIWLEQLPEKLKKSPPWLNKKAEVAVFQGDNANAKRLYRISLKTIASLPVYKQNLPAFNKASQQAEKGLLQLNKLPSTL